MKKRELIAALASVPDDIDVWVHVPGQASQQATAVRYVAPVAPTDQHFVRIVAEKPE